MDDGTNLQTCGGRRTAPGVVATEIDFNNTFVGGSAACIERVLAHPELEALPIAIDARVDAYGDTINV